MVYPDVGGDLARRVRHAVTESDALYLRVRRVECPHQDAHRVGVVHEQGARAQLPHLLGELEHEGYGSQSAEDTAYPHRVGDGLLQAVLARDLEVQERRLVHSDLDHDDDEVRAFKGGAPVQVLLDLGFGLELTRGPAGHHSRGLEALRVYVVQRDRSTPQVGELEDVGQQVLGELDATGADERYLGHKLPWSEQTPTTGHRTLWSQSPKECRQRNVPKGPLRRAVRTDVGRAGHRDSGETGATVP